MYRQGIEQAICAVRCPYIQPNAPQKTGQHVYCPLPAFVVAELECVPCVSGHYWFWTGSGTVETARKKWSEALADLLATGEREERSSDSNPRPRKQLISVGGGPACELLVGCEEAAGLLGNIHVKTLQRYARQGSVPGYRIGGHWYFRITELDAWLRSRINSNCQSAR